MKHFIKRYVFPVTVAVVPFVGEHSIAETVTVDASTITGIIPAIHGVNNGPLVRTEWNPPCGNNQVGDYSERFSFANIPQARTHGSGAIDISRIWRPWPSYIGQDPSDPANYDWQAADELLAAAMAVTTSYLRFGESANHGISSGGGCDASRPTATPPEDFAVFAQVAKHILKHYLQGWDNGFHYEIEYAEVWNEFYIADFWNGSGTDAARLYEAMQDAIKPEFPDIKLGASISLQYTQSGFMDYIRDNDVPIDYVAPHSYRPMPFEFRRNVHGNPGRDWESAFAAYGLSADTPIMFTEWNREGGCYNGGNGGGTSAIPAGAHLIASLIELADMHPDNSDHNVVMAHYFAAPKHLWNGAGANRPAGVALDAYGHDMVGETPQRLSLTGTHSNESDTDFQAIAGKSANNRVLNILVSYYSISDGACPLQPGAAMPLTLNVQKLPWGDAEFRWQRFAHTDTGSLTLQDSGSGSGGQFATTQTMRANAFELYKLTRSGNTPPQFNGTPLMREDATVGSPYSVSLQTSASDADGDALQFSFASGPAWLSCSSDGTLTGTPAATDAGANSWTVQVRDSEGATVETVLNISVLQSSSSPKVSSGGGGVISWLEFLALLSLVLWFMAGRLQRNSKRGQA